MKDKVVSGGALTQWFTTSSMPFVSQGDTHFLCVCGHPEGLRHVLGRSYPCPPLPGWCDWWDVATSSVALFPRFGLVPTSPIHGWTLVLLKVACSRPCCSISWWAVLQPSGVRLSSCCGFGLSNQLCADDLVILQESAADLQAALDAVSHWGQQWRFSFGIGPEKSSVVIFGPPRMLSLAKCTSKATFCLSSLPIPRSGPHSHTFLVHSCGPRAPIGLRSVCLRFDQRACAPMRFFRCRIRGRVLPQSSQI